MVRGFLCVTRKTRCVFLHSMEKVVIVNDDDGLRKGTLLDELTSPFAMRLTENCKLWANVVSYGKMSIGRFMQTQLTKRICLWSGPRNVSTALMYAFAQRSDTRVIDEPLYGYYLHVVSQMGGASHPGSAEVMAAMRTDSEQVIREVILGPCEKPVLFMKQMAHHLVDIDFGFMRETVNVLLIRDPREMLPSLEKVIGKPTLADTGLKRQAELLQYLKDLGQSPPVLDSRELLRDAEGVLRQLCERLGIPFERAMLSWPRGPHPDDGVWAKHWYGNVHQSTGFVPYRPKTEPFPPALRDILEECAPYYDFLSFFCQSHCERSGGLVH